MVRLNNQSREIYWIDSEKFEDDTLRFMKESMVSFTNNRAENDLRMTKVQQKEGKFIDQKLSSISTKNFLLQSLAEESNCTCQMQSHGINTALAGSEIDIGVFRSGCDLTSSDNIVVEEGKLINGSPNLYVDKVRISNIQPTGTTGKGIVAHITYWNNWAYTSEK